MKLYLILLTGLVQARDFVIEKNDIGSITENFNVDLEDCSAIVVYLKTCDEFNMFASETTSVSSTYFSITVPKASGGNFEMTLTNFPNFKVTRATDGPGCDVPTEFWLSWAGAELRLGFGSIVGDKQILTSSNKTAVGELLLIGARAGQHSDLIIFSAYAKNCASDTTTTTTATTTTTTIPTTSATTSGSSGSGGTVSNGASSDGTNGAANNGTRNSEGDVGDVVSDASTTAANSEGWAEKVSEIDGVFGNGTDFGGNGCRATDSMTSLTMLIVLALALLQ